MTAEETRSRFKDAPWFDVSGGTMCLVGGAGGIGSWLSLLLARANFMPVVYDYDTVEVHNIGGQLYSTDDIELHKVDALTRIVRKHSGVSMLPYREKYTSSSPSHIYVFAAFDNMQARQDMFNNWVKYVKDNHKNAIFIDGRLLMEQLQIICVTPDNIDKYREEYLFPDSDVEEVACTLKQTSHTAALIASLMVGFFTNHITNVTVGRPVRKVPFYHEYFVPLNLTS